MRIGQSRDKRHTLIGIEFKLQRDCPTDPTGLIHVLLELGSNLLQFLKNLLQILQGRKSPRSIVNILFLAFEGIRLPFCTYALPLFSSICLDNVIGDA